MESPLELKLINQETADLGPLRTEKDFMNFWKDLKYKISKISKSILFHQELTF